MRRVQAEQASFLHKTLKRAAEIQGRTLTDFVIAAVEDAAQRAIKQTEVICLSLADQQHFAQALLSPPKPAPALRRAMARYDKLVRSQ